MDPLTPRNHKETLVAFPHAVDLNEIHVVTAERGSIINRNLGNRYQAVAEISKCMHKAMDEFTARVEAAGDNVEERHRAMEILDQLAPIAVRNLKDELSGLETSYDRVKSDSDLAQVMLALMRQKEEEEARKRQLEGEEEEEERESLELSGEDEINSLNDNEYVGDNLLERESEEES